MDPNTLQFGSGSPLLGGSSAIQEAMARRGVDASILQQVGGNAPTAMPMPQQPQSGVMGQMPSPDATMQGAVPQQGVPQGSDEASIILNALATRLKSDSKIKESQAIPPQPPKLPGMA